MEFDPRTYLVVRNVPDFQVVVGNPARVIKDVRELADYDASQFTAPPG